MKVCKLILALIIAILPFQSPVLAQSIEVKARVIDSSSFEPVAFTTVYLNQYTGTISDEMGFFRIRLSPEELLDTFQISCIGYDTRYIPVKELQTADLDSIYLHQNSMELGEAEITARGKKTQSSGKIIRMAVQSLLNNYPTFTHLQNGYYREYIKSDADYVNLFESIVNIEDPGFQSVDNFKAGLQFKRINRQFPVDSLLLRPYDNREKFVPFSFMPISINNELLILRAHNPVRNYNRQSLYFIDRLEEDFLKNHKFSTPRLTYLDDRPYYQISMKDKQKYHSGMNHIYTEGTIYIDAFNYGIKRIEYKSTLDNGVSQRKLFGLNLEYKLENGLYYPHYHSFNNLFYTRNFALLRSGPRGNQLVLTFRRPVNEMYEGDPENISVFMEDTLQEIKELEIQGADIILSFAKKSDIGELLEINTWPQNAQTRNKITRNRKYLKENLSFEFGELKDVYGNELLDHELNVHYQYREFFSRTTEITEEGIGSNLVNKSIPVINSRIFGESTSDTSWLNTPLIKEDISSRHFYSSNPKLNNFIEQMYQSSDGRLNETLYIQADREVYAPEDTLWFKAYIRNRKFLTESELSKVFHIMLTSEDGRIIYREKYLVEESGVKGQIALEDDLEEGIYYLSGYSSWMENFGTEALYTKRIQVEKEKRDGHLLAVAFEKSSYFPGDTVRMLVNCYNEYNQPVEDVSFRYRLLDGENTMQRGKASTGRSWLEPILLVLPDSIGSQPVIELKSIYASEVLDKVYSIPSVIDLQLDFFPEGGSSLQGVSSNVAFMAMNSRGDPVEITGEVIDDEGKVLLTTSSLHEGRGMFRISPDRGENYYLRITDPPATGKHFKLPEARERGWQLQLNKEAGDQYLELELTNKNTGNDTALITVMVRDYICYKNVIRVRGRRKVRIPLEDLPCGTAVLTLFDNQLIPRAERLLFIRPSESLDVELKTDRNQYLTRDSVRLTLSLESDRPLLPGGSFAISVIDDQLGSSASINEPGIVSSMLFSGEIRGPISNPDQYFNRADNESSKHLDLLCLTQGWRNYDFRVQTPKNRDVISGKLSRPKLKSSSDPVEGRVSIHFGGNSSYISVENDGTFSFLPDYSPEFSNEIFIYGEDKRGRSNLSIALNSSTFEDNLEDYLQYLVDSLGRDEIPYGMSRKHLQDHFSYRLENHYWLEEVVIRKKMESKELRISDLAINKREATPEELEMAIDMEDLQLIVQKPNSRDYQVFYSIDGILQFTMIPGPKGIPIKEPLYDHALYLRPEEIETYIVITGPTTQFLYGMDIHYVIDVTTKPISERPLNRWSNPLRIEALSVSKEFFRPQYDSDALRYSSIPDLRKTIHWEPDLKIGEDGKATVTFYNGDRYTNIKCILEGITEEGIPVHAEHFYKVSLSRD